MKNKILAEEELMSINKNGKTLIHIPKTERKYWYFKIPFIKKSISIRKPFTNKRFFKIGWLKPYTSEKITEILVTKDVQKISEFTDAISNMNSNSKVISKSASYILLNNFFLIKLFHFIHWRWLFYVREYTWAQYSPLFFEAKKKTDAPAFSVNMGLLATMKESKMTMMTKEVEQYQAELSSVVDHLSEKNTHSQ